MSGLRRLTCAAIVLGLLSGANRSSHPFARETRAAQTTDVAFLIRSIVETMPDSPSGPRTLAEQQQLTALYGSESYLPLWVDRSGRANHDAREALALLQGATNEALDPLDYDAGTLQHFTARPGGADVPGVADIARFDEMNAAWEAWIDPANPPARATVEAKLASPDYLVEISVIAAKP